MITSNQTNYGAAAFTPTVKMAAQIFSDRLVADPNYRPRTSDLDSRIKRRAWAQAARKAGVRP